ncbi:LysR family transcriptional regulator [Aliagarivorans marinus]|uniref:LysR family transcriptional regulator n=1 Tax=Aliagarivorans marinus TaxID=561965 RepID=UPI00041E6C3C|nr:LysR family transcriptional regulator [Aliagarivorans marinus]
MDQLQAMHYFVLVAEQGSFSAVADALNCPVSKVSRQIQALESTLKGELVLRSTRRNQLTELGQLYLPRCREILAAVAQSNDVVAQYQSLPSGRLRITAMPSYAELQLLPAIEGLQQRYPQLVIDLELTDQVMDFYQHNIDIAIRGGLLGDQRLVAHRLEDNQFLLCAAPSYLKHYGRPSHYRELVQHYALDYRSPRGELPWRVKEAGNWVKVDVQKRLVTNSTQLLLRQVLEGKGLAMLPLWSIRSYLAAGQLELLDLEPTIGGGDSDLGVHLLYQRSRYEVPKVRVAVDYLLAQLCENSGRTNT